MDLLVRIQLPSAEDREGFLRNIRFKNAIVVEQFNLFLMMFLVVKSDFIEQGEI